MLGKQVTLFNPSLLIYLEEARTTSLWQILQTSAKVFADCRRYCFSCPGTGRYSPSFVAYNPLPAFVGMAFCPQFKTILPMAAESPVSGEKHQKLPGKERG